MCVCVCVTYMWLYIVPKESIHVVPQVLTIILYIFLYHTKFLKMQLTISGPLSPRPSCHRHTHKLLPILEYIEIEYRILYNLFPVLVFTYMIEHLHP
jgi:hypothetical protein